MRNQPGTRSRQKQPTLWLVERLDWLELLSAFLHHESNSSLTSFSPTGVLEALECRQELPDILVTAFYFNGGTVSGLRIVHELRTIAPAIPAIVISGFPSAHVQGAAADWQVRLDYTLQKGVGSNILEELRRAIQDLGLIERSEVVQPCWRRDPMEALALTERRRSRKPAAKRRIKPNRKPLVYLVGHSNCWRMLRTYAEEMAAMRFKRSCDYDSFSDETCAWANLSQPGIKPDLLITDYYLNGGFINGLKLISHAQTMIPGICTILVGCGYSRLHLQGAIEGTGISPDWFFHD
ncbi:MAG TPA: hypothetical protein VFE51_18850 [Verrucomicrobiae bacterium]|nr:hypothetical protein [Verrucomicrobiae bacterium]